MGGEGFDGRRTRATLYGVRAIDGVVDRILAASGERSGGVLPWREAFGARMTGRGRRYALACGRQGRRLAATSHSAERAVWRMGAG
jgi:hypothetical protein